MSEAAPPSLREGELVAEKYRLEHEIGRGGMGVVWAARHETLKHAVALKALLPEANAVPNAIERFSREARAVATLKSDHVVRVFDVGVLPSGLPYMVMELLEGRNLVDELEARGPVPPAIACGWILEATEAIAEAHAAGIVHRDLKPSNLFLAERPSGPARIKVLDFGISKFQGEKLDGDLTSTRAVLGTPHYMSPEQCRNAKNVDGRTDIWSLGVILHELLTGARLFGGDAVGEIFAQVLADPIPSPRSCHPDVPPEIDALVMRCLERAPARRITLADLRDALASRSGELGSVESVDRAPSSPRSELESAPTLEARSQTVGGLSRSTTMPVVTRWRRIAAVGGGLALVGSVTAWSFHRSATTGASAPVEPPATASPTIAPTPPPAPPAPPKPPTPTDAPSPPPSEAPPASSAAPDPSAGFPATPKPKTPPARGRGRAVGARPDAGAAMPLAQPLVGRE